MTFYKGLNKKDLKEYYIPGTVTQNFNEALMWKERVSSKKNKGAAKHVVHGDSVVIEIIYDDTITPILSHDEFQKANVAEHARLNCWTSQAKIKAQINTPVKYRILTDEEIDKLFSI